MRAAPSRPAWTSLQITAAVQIDQRLNFIDCPADALRAVMS